MNGKQLERWTQDVHEGDAKEVLAEMPSNSIHMAMTSPPYFGLRDYGVDGQIGLEDSLDEYIQDLVDVADELRRVLRNDGSWWLNLGDSFAGSWGAQSKDETLNNLPQHGFPDKNPARNGKLRRKSKMLVPHRVAIALQNNGWIVRSDGPWVKPNPMPHPVKDRLHEHKEFVFHLVPEPDYWFDLDAIREPHAESSLDRTDSSFEASGRGSETAPREDDPEHIGTEPEDALHPNGKNPGDVFEIPVKPFPEAHFAVYPKDLCEKPIKASAPPKVCAECGKPYEREVERTRPPEPDRDNENRLGPGERGNVGDGGIGPRYSQLSGQEYVEWKEKNPDKFKGWQKQCGCPTDETRPGIVLDPFAGSGTTVKVAKELGRRFVGIELNPEYVAMAQKRVGVTVDNPGLLLDENETALSAFADGGGSSE